MSIDVESVVARVVAVLLAVGVVRQTVTLRQVDARASELAATAAAPVEPRPPPPPPDPAPCVPSGSWLVANYAGAQCAPGRQPWVPDSSSVVVSHVIVAVLPDPIESHLDWGFDAEVESMRRAFESAEYVLDRFWLAWRPAPASAQAPGATRATVHHTAPGVMLFRRAGPVDSLAVVYLVGEVPTTGIHRVAFDSALVDRARLLRMVDPGNPGRAGTDSLRVVGPTFSGTVPSLRHALAAARRARVIGPTSVVSGGATAPGNATTLREHTPGVAFHATVNPVDRLQRYIQTVLGTHLGIAPREIAYLRESGTGYGMSFATPHSTTHDPVPAATNDSVMRAELDSALLVPFPMNISRLRREYVRNVLPGDTIGRGQTSITRIDWRDPAASVESPAPLSELTAPTIERTLADIEQTLTLHHIRAVGIMATDVRDRLFLATIVKERLHDVQLFFIGSHSLYLRPELNRQLRGALVVSTYPLFLENQFWDLTHSGRERVVFTSDASEGTYNATLAQLGHAHAMTDYAYPLRRGAPLVPPVWLTTVGASSLLPVAADSGGPAAGGGYVLRRDSLAWRSVAEARHPHESVEAVILIALLGTALAVAVGWGARGFRDPARDPAATAPVRRR